MSEGILTQPEAPAIASASAAPGISITFFPTYAAQYKTEQRLTLPELEQMLRTMTPQPTKQSLPWLKLATFGEQRTEKNCLRSDANVQHVDGIEIDLDNGVLSFDAVCSRLESAGIEALVVTSGSYTPEYPKLRVLLPLAARLNSSTENMKVERGRMVARINGLLGGNVARESFVLSQAFYFGPVEGREYHVRRIEGLRCVDEATGLPEDWGTWRQQPASPPAPGEAPRQEARVDLSVLTADLIRGEHYHGPLVSLSAALAARGVPRDTAQELLEGLFDAADDRGDLERHREEIDRTLASGYMKFAPVTPVEIVSTADARPAIDVISGWQPPTREQLTTVPPIDWAVEPWVQAGHAGLMAAGGNVGKTTVTMLLGISMVTARPFLGQPVRRQGTFVLISRDDAQEDLEAVRAELIRAEGLSEAEIEQVRTKFRLFGLRGAPDGLLLANAEQGRAAVASPFAAALIKTLVEVDDLVGVGFDTVRQFSGRESNDEQAQGLLMNIMAVLAQHPNRPFVMGLHHVSKEAARGKIDDQYAAIGTSALADYARFVFVLIKEEAGDIVVPFAGEDGEATAAGVDYLRLVSARGNVRAKAPEALILSRDGYRIRALASARRKSKDQREAERKQERDTGLAAAVLEALKDGPLTKTALRERVKARAAVVDGVIEQLVGSGKLVEAGTVKGTRGVLLGLSTGC
jgi:hypothetical protein